MRLLKKNLGLFSRVAVHCDSCTATRNARPGFVAGSFFLLLFLTATAAQGSETEPIVGLRDEVPRIFALEHATVVVRPGSEITDATVVVRGETIEAVGKQVEVPAGAMRIDLSGRHVYAGFIDLSGEVDVPLPADQAGYWNDHITPRRAVADVVRKRGIEGENFRKQGITLRLLSPRGGIVKGTSSLVLMLESDSGDLLLETDLAQHLQLTVPRSGPARSDYPNSPMGAVALLRQSIIDADWYASAMRTQRNAPHVERPTPNEALEVLSEWIRQGRFIIDAPNERMAVRARQLADEFSLAAIVQGSGREYRRLDEIAALNTPLLIPIDFPDAPDVTDPDVAADASLQSLLHWHFAPANPALLHARDVTFAITTAGLENAKDFLDQLRTAVERDLPEDAALAAITTTPAKLMGVERRLGSVERGKFANLVVTDGPLFGEKTKVLETWVAGNRYQIDPDHERPLEHLIGDWVLTVGNAAQREKQLLLSLEEKDDALSGTISSLAESAPNESNESAAKEKAKLKKVIRGHDRLSATVELGSIDDRFAGGVSQLVLRELRREADQEPEILGELTLPNGTRQRLQVERQQPDDDDETAITDESPKATPADDDDAEESSTEPALADLAVTYPLGAYGRLTAPEQSESVLFKGATIWSCGSAGIIQNGQVLVRNGTIVEVGQNIDIPAGCEVIDITGRHLTPGLIDCHSHMATDGGVNESAQAVTAEVRVGDFIDNSDITIYRQLAGGLTTSNILHGSANPIGGQNAVIKLRWGGTMDELRFADAPPGIKFALGENVKRSNRDGPQTRYPKSRMGVERIIRDQLQAAREYDEEWARWKSGQRDRLPPRRDLQLEALAEVVRGERWIHCHSYRQDEIVTLLNTLEEFGIRIGTLQHILEGYKVADRMKEHGAMGSSFADWWAYKFEVFDSIPYNGALMHDQGVIVSFNSDNAELGRRLNTEAAKAMRYGSVPPEEALKFVTLNPARQLRIDDRVGSIEAGKDADLVVWDGPPLATTTACEQTWIDGRRYFDRREAEQIEERDRTTRQRLIQAILTAGKSDGADTEKPVAEEDRWERHDAFCHVDDEHDGTNSRHLHENTERHQ